VSTGAGDGAAVDGALAVSYGAAALGASDGVDAGAGCSVAVPDPVVPVPGPAVAPPPADVPVVVVLGEGVLEA
jgi:hypothetical protein